MRAFKKIMAALAVLLIAGGGVAVAQTAAPPVQVAAASSLTDALNQIGDAYARHGHSHPVFNFAASSTLAHQIEQGANADVFISADEDWMNYLETKNLVAPHSRVTILTNRLVLIAPADHPLHLTIRNGFNLSGALAGGHLTMADPDSVPAGRYGRAALEHLHVWQSVSDAVVRAENVRAALRLVETGEAAAGIVYATDAQASGARVMTVGVFPADSHPPIRYPMASVAGHDTAPARDFERFLRSSEARAIFRRQGFGFWG